MNNRKKYKCVIILIRRLVFSIIRAFMPLSCISIILHLYYFKRIPLKSFKTFNEKILWRKLYERSELFTMVSDKYLCRDYVKNIIGDRYLTKLYYVTKDPHSIPFDQLPFQYVIKANHDSNSTIIVSVNNTINRNNIIRQCEKWLKSDYSRYSGEWQYKHISRLIIVEELLKGSDDKLPNDYKFFVFNGETRLIQVDADRFTKLFSSLRNICFGGTFSDLPGYEYKR